MRTDRLLWRRVAAILVPCIVGVSAFAITPAAAAATPRVSATFVPSCEFSPVAVVFTNSDTITHVVGIGFGASASPPFSGPIVTAVLAAGRSTVLLATTPPGAHFEVSHVDGLPLGAANALLPCKEAVSLVVTMARGQTVSDPAIGCLTAWHVAFAPKDGMLSYPRNATTKLIDVAYTAAAVLPHSGGGDYLYLVCPSAASGPYLLLLSVAILPTPAAPPPSTSPALANTGPRVMPLVLLAGLLLATGSLLLLVERKVRSRGVGATR